jgi:hypothetical protein
MTFITHGFRFQWYRTYERGYETSGSRLRFMLRRSSLVECVSVLHGIGVYKASIFFCQSYPRVSQILLSCTSPGVRPYISVPLTLFLQWRQCMCHVIFHQTLYICCFSAKHAAIRKIAKTGYLRIRIMCSDMSTRGLLWARTIQIQLSVLV